MTNKNQPKNSQEDRPSRPNERTTGRSRRAHCIQPWLSTRDKLVLLTICLNALGLLAVILYYTTDSFTVAPRTIKFLSGSASRNGASAEVRMGDEITFEEMFQEIASQYELDWQLLARLAYRESGLDPLAVRKKDKDTGLMQIIPSTWAEWAPKVGVSDPFDPYSNVLVGAAYLAFLREYFGEMGYPEDHWILVAYNWGPHNLHQFLERGGRWAEVPEKQRRYALDILQSASDTPPGWEEIRNEVVTRKHSLPPFAD
jgi:hypothetical protein